ncbi:MAG: hypothetical protein KKC55_17815 [Gammaproteobacteria bacterium]|nr:hypothetical protein [Gammaproteobacteria bacterium]
MNETLKAAGNLGAELGAARAEVEVLREQVRALPSDANSWQSGYDKGRLDGARHRKSEVDQLRGLLRRSLDYFTEPGIPEDLLAEYRAALFQQAEPECDRCKDTGEMDSGGVQPWGAAILVPCDCQAEPAPASTDGVNWKAVANEHEAFKRALHSQKVFKLSSATIDAAEWAWFNRPAQPEQAVSSQAEHRVLLLASYCGEDNSDCSDEHPCPECLKMCNVALIKGRPNVLGGMDYTRPARKAEPAPQPEQSGLIGQVCGGDGTNNTVNVAVVGPVPWGDLRIGTPVRLIPATAAPSPAPTVPKE